MFCNLTAFAHSNIQALLLNIYIGQWFKVHAIYYCYASGYSRLVQEGWSDEDDNSTAHGDKQLVYLSFGDTQWI